jgi:NTE family protein
MMLDDIQLDNRPQARLKDHPPGRRPPFECIALLLQGGGALGAYQGGVYEALAEADLHPDWTAGISIGAINAALIAGNPPEKRVEKLREFWELVTSPGYDSGPAPLLNGDTARTMLNQWSAGRALSLGAAGFFAPRPRTPWLWPHGSIEATSYYDTRPLRATLERLVDFDRVDSGGMRFSVGAVNVRTGNYRLFRLDNAPHPPGARDGERGAAARMSRDRDRRRALLGRRPDLEHAAELGGRQPSAPRYARIPGRSLVV